MKNKINVFYKKGGKVYLVENTYDKSFKKVERVLDYAKNIGLKIPDKEKIEIVTLKGVRYNRMMCVEFPIQEIPSTGIELTSDSPFWKFLIY